MAEAKSTAMDCPPSIGSIAVSTVWRGRSKGSSIRGRAGSSITSIAGSASRAGRGARLSRVGTGSASRAGSTAMGTTGARGARGAISATGAIGAMGAIGAIGAIGAMGARPGSFAIPAPAAGTFLARILTVKLVVSTMGLVPSVAVVWTLNL